MLKAANACKERVAGSECTLCPQPLQQPCICGSMEHRVLHCAVTPSHPAHASPPSCRSDLEDGDASEQEPDFDAELATAGGDSSDDEELATAGGDSSDDEEIRALLRRARGGGKASGDGDSDAEEEEDSEAGVSGSSDEEEGGSEDEGGMQLAGGEHGQLDSDDEFDLDEAASEGGSDEE